MTVVNTTEIGSCLLSKRLVNLTAIFVSVVQYKVYPSLAPILVKFSHSHSLLPIITNLYLLQ